MSNRCFAAQICRSPSVKKGSWGQTQIWLTRPKRATDMWTWWTQQIVVISNPCSPSRTLTMNIWGGKMDFSGRKYFLQIFPSASITILFGKQKQTERRSWIWKDRRISYSFDAMTGQWDWERKYLQIFENIWTYLMPWLVSEQIK